MTDRFLESNLTNAALLRDAEREIAARAVPPLDLRGIPRAEWTRHLHAQLAIPEGIRRYLAGELTGAPPSFPLDRATVHAMERQVEEWHGITAPWHVAMELPVSQHGRAWRHVPEAAPYLTGFVLGKDEA